MERKLTAVLAADIVGYSRLMSENQAATLAALKVLREELLSPTIRDQRGNLIKSMGDGWIIEFPSISDAVACALLVQENLSSHAMIKLRIGIHIGEVVFESDDIFGDGVNVAARLEALAQPGQVLLSDSAHHSLDRQAAGQFSNAGEYQLKNIPRPVGVWYWPEESGLPAQEKAAKASDPFDKASIAVLPFENLSGEGDQEFFADGITEDIITALSKFRWLMVIARNSSFSFKGQNLDVREIGRTLGVRYLLEGSVRRAGNRVRITGQLVDAGDGAHLWADKFDGQLDDIFDLQDQVSLDVICAIEPSLRQAETERLRRKPTEDLQAYELYLRALSHFHSVTDQDNLEAIALLSRAVELDPGYAIAGGLLGWCQVQRAVQNWALEPKAKDDALTLAHSVLKNDRADAMALAYAAHVLVMFAGDLEKAQTAFERSLAENPNSALAHTLCSVNCTSMGRFEAALEHGDQALRLSPRDTFRYSFHLARSLALLYLGRFGESAEAAKASVMDRGNFLLSRHTLVAALAASGDLDAAKQAVQELLAINPDITVSKIRQGGQVFRGDQAEKFERAWLDAGIPA